MPLNKLEDQPGNLRETLHSWRLQTVLAGIFCLAAAASAQETTSPPSDDTTDAEEELRRYTVEIIVFTYADSVSSGSEIFIPDTVDEPVEPAKPLLDTGDDSQSGFMPGEEIVEDSVPEYGDFLGDIEDEELIELIASDRIDLKVLMPDELTMTEIHEKLVLLDAYQPVMWAGWTQVTLAEEETPLIRLRRLGNLPLAFDGMLKLYLSRFLHLVIDISMDGESPPVAEELLPQVPTSRFDRGYLDDFGYPIFTDAVAPTVHYRIIENRIVKNGDIRYFDHPKFGIVAKVTRYEAPAEDEEVGIDPGRASGDAPEGVPIEPLQGRVPRRDRLVHTAPVNLKKSH